MGCVLVGRIGASVYADQSVEFLNEEQKPRGLGRFLLSMLTFTRLLQPLLHVHRRYRAFVGIPEQADEGFRVGMVNEVEVLVKFFLEKLGTDLRTPDTKNPFWHTGIPKEWVAGAATQHVRPEEWMWRVADGRSRGERAGTREGWLPWVTRMVKDHMFYK